MFELATLFLFAYALRSRKSKVWPFLLAGLIGGLGFYTYISYRIFPLAVLAFLLDAGNRKQARERISHLLIAVVLAAAVVLPLMFFFVQHPESFTYRLRSTGLAINRSEPLPKLLLYTAKNALGMFTFIGDPFSRQNVNAEQELSPFITGFFLLGIILTLKNLRKPFAPFLFFWLIIGLLPTVFSLPSPHAGRALGALPPALILAGFGLFGACQILSQATAFLIRPVLFVVLGGALLTGPNDALFRYSNYLDSYDPDAGMNRLEYNITKLVQSGGTECQYYLSPQFFFHASVEYLSYPRARYELFNYHTEFDPQKISIVVLETEPRLLWWLTDSDEKNFFKWWHQYYGYSINDIREWNAEIYDLPPKLPQSDAPLLARLKRQYPNGKEIRLDYFTLFVLK
jgi:4-amino-4-deoxy-L-arabinose transferase-like glycosyltransferase